MSEQFITQLGNPINKSISPANKSINPANKSINPANKSINPANKSINPINKLISHTNKSISPIQKISIYENEIKRINELVDSNINLTNTIFTQLKQIFKWVKITNIREEYKWLEINDKYKALIKQNKLYLKYIHSIPMGFSEISRYYTFDEVKLKEVDMNNLLNKIQNYIYEFNKLKTYRQLIIIYVKNKSNTKNPILKIAKEIKIELNSNLSQLYHQINTYYLNILEFDSMLKNFQSQKCKLQYEILELDRTIMIANKLNKN
jgi:hypothetical protein